MNFKKYADNLVIIWPCLCLQKALDWVVFIAASKNNHKIHNALLFYLLPIYYL